MTSTTTIRIGTRESALALYQAKEVQRELHAKGFQTQLVEITSDGDIDLKTPLYEMGIQGIFTKSLDIALLQNRIDIAVHSAKDIPTKLAKGLVISAFLKRGTTHDCLVLPNGEKEFDPTTFKKIASSSLRRRSQWLHRYPHHEMDNLRGNIQTRLKKLDSSDWDGAIFAQTALERLEISSHQIITLDWMLPAPAQGAMAIVCRGDHRAMLEVCKSIHHEPTGVCVNAERDYLAELQGGCAVPIAAQAVIHNDQLHFKGNLFSLDGKQKVEIEKNYPLDQATQAGSMAAKEILATGGEPILKTFRN
jgi:hydroxymethylbilane synthase